jgi:hypothetical protein
VKLGNELIRAEIGDRRAVDNIVYLDKNFGSEEIGGLTILEVGVFVDGTDTKDS